MTVAERKELTEAWSKVVGTYGLTLIVHVGTESILDAVELAKHAAAHGAHAIATMPPVYFKPANPSVVAAWLKEVGAAAPELPLYYYHIPLMTGTHLMGMDLVKEVKKIGVPNFVGIKYTGLYDNLGFGDLQLLIEEHPELEFFCGREEMTVQAIAVGVKGIVGSQHNYANDLYTMMRQGDKKAVEAQRWGVKLLKITGPDGVDVHKAITEYAMGMSLGPARLPRISLSEEERATVYKAIDEWCVGAQASLDTKLQMCRKGAPPTVVV